MNWFKIAEEGLDTKTGKWGVDSMMAGNGWWNFTMPACVAAGQYLMRVELIGTSIFHFVHHLRCLVLLELKTDMHQALHSAYGTNGAQFYMS